MKDFLYCFGCLALPSKLVQFIKKFYGDGRLDIVHLAAGLVLSNRTTPTINEGFSYAFRSIIAEPFLRASVCFLPAKRFQCCGACEKYKQYVEREKPLAHEQGPKRDVSPTRHVTLILIRVS